jgi:dihydrofolate reductase
MEVKLVIVVARGRNGVIGARGDLPWKLSSDLKRFKAITLGKPVIMGRKTWTSIGRALPGRPNLVVTRDPGFQAEGATVWPNLDVAIASACAMASVSGAQEVCIIGGGELYNQTINLADRLYLTDVDAAPEGDAHFPPVDPAIWQEISAESVPVGPRDDHAFVARVLDRRP